MKSHMELKKAKEISNLSKKVDELEKIKKAFEDVLKRMMNEETTINMLDITVDFEGDHKPLIVPTGDNEQDVFNQHRVNTDITLFFSHREMMEFIGVMLRSNTNKIKALKEKINTK